jgi:hypothetical protein
MLPTLRPSESGTPARFTSIRTIPRNCHERPEWGRKRQRLLSATSRYGRCWPVAGIDAIRLSGR